VAFHNAFHGRTSGAVAVTDNPTVQAPFNKGHKVIFSPLGDTNALEHVLATSGVAAVIIEGIQGVGGIFEGSTDFWVWLRAACDRYGVVLIADEIQSGYGRSGDFFAHQAHGIKADLITVAKGMGNGFPMGGVLIGPGFEAKHGMLGTTFGGNHLAAVAGIAVLDIIAQERLMQNAKQIGDFLIAELRGMEGVKEVRGRGLMLGIELEEPAAAFRKKLLFEHKIFTGSASCKKTIRLLPPLTMKQEHAEIFLAAFRQCLEEAAVSK